MSRTSTSTTGEADRGGAPGRAEALYDKVFFEYGDDSVAQLGGVHLACEQSSNLLTKVLEWGRLMAYLEQSTRYIAYDARLDGRYRYWRDPAISDSPLGARYVGEMDGLFDLYAQALGKVTEWARAAFPKQEGDSDFVWRQTVKAKACDAVRGMLPAASLSNVGIYGTGQGYEALLLRMRAHPLPEVRRYAQMMLEELRAVIPSFLQRVDREDRGVVWSRYFEERRDRTEAMAAHLLGDEQPQPAAHGAPGGPRSRRRGQGAGRHPLQRLGPARVPARGAGGQARARGTLRPPRRLRGGAPEPASQARAAPSNGRGTGSTSSPTTAPSATCSATGC